MSQDIQITCDLTEIPLPEVGGPGSGTDCQTEERRAWILNRIKELGHPDLLDTERVANIFEISSRQVYYDRDHVMDWVEEEIVGQHHTGKNWTVFEKAKREAMREGSWETAVNIVEKEADWLESRGEINAEPDQHEVTADVSVVELLSKDE